MAEREYERDEAGRFGTTGTGGGGGATGTVEPPAATGGAAPLAPLSPRAQQNIGAVENAIRGQDFETGACVSKDGQPILRKDGTGNQVNFTAAEAESMRGGVFTHNHPRGDSFSAEDVRMAGTVGLAEIRATTRDGTTYRMQPQEGRSWPDQRQIAAVMGAVREQTRDAVIAAVRSGGLTREQGAVMWSHNTWTAAAPRLGLVYTRER